MPCLIDSYILFPFQVQVRWRDQTHTWESLSELLADGNARWLHQLIDDKLSPADRDAVHAKFAGRFIPSITNLFTPFRPNAYDGSPISSAPFKVPRPVKPASSSTPCPQRVPEASGGGCDVDPAATGSKRASSKRASNAAGSQDDSGASGSKRASRKRASDASGDQGASGSKRASNASGSKRVSVSRSASPETPVGKSSKRAATHDIPLVHLTYKEIDEVLCVVFYVYYIPLI